MSAIVTLNIFSGRPNPQWILDDAATSELRERITFRPTVTAAAPPGSVRGLGYRGLEVRFDNSGEAIHVHGGVVGTLTASPNAVDTDRGIDKFLIGTMPDADRVPSLALSQEAHGLVPPEVRKDLPQSIPIDIPKIIINPS